VFTDFQHTKLYPFQILSLGFILKILLKFRKFQPRYSYKIYSYKKECMRNVWEYRNFPNNLDNIRFKYCEEYLYLSSKQR